jgi:hypothetical protein
LNPSKLTKSRGLPPRTPLHETYGNPKSITFSHGFKRGSPRKEPQGAHVCIPHQICKGKASKPPKENCQENDLKITKKEKWERRDEHLRNHVEPSRHTMNNSYKVQLASSTSIPRDLTMKLSR